MLKIGLTGGIGSGKTTVAKIFEVLGIPVYYADDETRKLMNTDPTIRKSIIENFGEQAYADDQLDRKFLAGIVFNDPQKLTLLNSLTHPHTIRHADEWAAQQTSPYIIKEAALLFESDAYKSLDKIIGVSSPLPLRMQRVIERDAITEEEVKKRMARQMGEEEKMKRCDFIIINDEQQMILPQVLALHEKFSTR